MQAELSQELFPLLNNHFAKPLCNRLQQAECVLENMVPHAGHPWLEATPLLQLIQQQQTDLPALPTEPIGGFTHSFSVLFPALETWIQSKPQLIEQEQAEDRFKIAAQDKLLLKTGKRFKSLAYSTSQAPKKFGNRFRKNKVAINRWQHTIPYQNLLRYHLQVNLLPQLSPLVESAENLLQQLYLAAREASEIPHLKYTKLQPAQAATLEKKQDDWKNLLKKSRELQTYITGQIQVLLNSLAEEVEHDFLRVDTIELSPLEFSEWRTHKFHTRELSRINALWQDWQHAHQALISQWQLRLRLYQTLYQWQAETQKLRTGVSQGLSTAFWPAFKTLFNTLQELKKKVAQENLVQAIEEGRKIIKQELQADKVREIVAGLVQQDLAGKVQVLEQKLISATDNLPEQTRVAKNGQLDHPLRQAEIASIQPKKLVKLELLPKAENQLVELKVNIVQGVEEARDRLLELEDVCQFNLESAGAFFADHPEDEAKAKAIAFEGLDRTINQIRQVEQSLKQLEQEVPEVIEATLNQLYNELMGLRKADNLWSLQLRLLKASALQTSSNLIEKIEARIGTRLPGVIKKLESGLNWTRRQQSQLQSRLGLQAVPPSIATEVTDFLQENESALQRLPFVYRRLYNTDPLQEELFFVGRKAELASIENMYQRWKEGRYASLLLVGERGSGLTSLFNIFTKKLPAQQKIIRIKLPLHPQDAATLLKVVGEAFGTTEPGSFEELGLYIKENHQGSLVIAEDIQRLFFRQIGGFALIKNFNSLVADTSNKVCWFASCNLYSWQYLNRAVGGADSWAQVLTMQAFTKEQLSNLIMQRHRVSGYHLVFEPAENDKHSKKFQSLEVEARQKYLQDKFFQMLAGFSQSNLRLALLYWLRSTLSVSKNTITLSTSLNLEFGFLNNLGTDKYFTLRQLLLHDILPAKTFALLQQNTEASARYQLQTLYDVGLLVKHQDLGYGINPLLYRQVVNILKQKNYIH